MLLLSNIRERLTAISLNEDEYFAAVEKAADLGIVGGTTYDSLLAYCALKAKADRIYTWNMRHFELMGGEIKRRVKTPA